MLPVIMPSIDRAIIPLARYVIGDPPLPVTSSAVEPAPAAIGKYVSAWPMPPPLTDSGSSGGDSRTISPFGSAGGCRRSGRRNSSVLTQNLRYRCAYG